MEAKAIKTDKYFNPSEISKHLENVEYIIMAAPAPSSFKNTPIQFTIFLNTDEKLPQDVKDAILDKFLDENSIKSPIEVMSQLMPVGFSMSSQDTPMPLLLVSPEDQRSIPYSVMHVMDFLADSDNFYEAKTHKLTGWTYSYN
ncbi:hypothetical protein HUE87_09670 [Candidatus Sulfurimonas marisnigri]|uniref:Uncharacterized protein n=1 Tax=Candidatus Sulfurimonas marisnigri TaxID=2740405 RepID=A0A7S7LZ69_9BACT|nr:hypothetical protein [Candidatus Sulfurimonas marisnigri]QOY54144.1 hypothetical protein HUE87_09670 [Candidatus Sulfurimonas marisnigri]